MMTFQEEEWARQRRQSTKQAISLAMEGNWEEAVAVNRSILEVFPDDVEALNRLGRAHLELGDYHEAEAAYRHTTEIDPYNAIAVKNLQRLSHLREVAAAGEVDANRLEPQYFIEEIGKAGVVRLEELAPPDVIARMVAGDRLQLRIDGTDLIAENSRGVYLGRVEPEHGQRLARLMDGGNQYLAAVVSLTEGAVRVIVREIFRDPGQAGPGQAAPQPGTDPGGQSRLCARRQDHAIWHPPAQIPSPLGDRPHLPLPEPVLFLLRQFP